MKNLLVILSSVVLLSACATHSRVSDDGDLSGNSYSYAASSPSYNNGSPSHTAQSTAGKMISPVTGY
jgi:hypothetical protein